MTGGAEQAMLDNVTKLYTEWLTEGYDLTPKGMIRRLSSEMMCDQIVQT